MNYRAVQELVGPVLGVCPVVVVVVPHVFPVRHLDHPRALALREHREHRVRLQGMIFVCVKNRGLCDEGSVARCGCRYPNSLGDRSVRPAVSPGDSDENLVVQVFQELAFDLEFVTDKFTIADRRDALHECLVDFRFRHQLRRQFRAEGSPQLLVTVHDPIKLRLAHEVDEHQTVIPVIRDSGYFPVNCISFNLLTPRCPRNPAHAVFRSPHHHPLEGQFRPCTLEGGVADAGSREYV